MLIDEVLTPDSSRYWSLASWVTDKKQDNFDKQLLRNFAEQLMRRVCGTKRPLDQ
jgi:phosphoribosylaminoimidazole-succinocarboxamide synthase